jgi:uncharacterized protein (TIGR02145 family)
MIRGFQPTYDKLLHLPQISYGRLYNWWAAAHANIAPIGYSVPTDAQWTTLTDYITAEIAAERLPDVGVGNVLKSQRQDPAGNTNVIIQTTTQPRFNADATQYGRDSVKFSSLPSGTRWTNGAFTRLGSWFRVWSKTERVDIPTTGWELIMSADASTTFRSSIVKTLGLCVKFMRSATSFEQSYFADGSFVGQVADVDNNVYDLVKIGTQVWSVQNLATTRYNDGTPIPGPTFTNEAWIALETPAYCNHGNDVTNVFLGSTVKTIWKTLRDREI